MIHELISHHMESNVFILEDKTTVMVDAGLGLDEHIVEYVKKKNLEIDLLINTHCHIDHIGGDRFFRTIAASEKDAPDIETGSEKTVAEWVFPSFQGFPISKILLEGDVVETGSFSLQVIETPGHTEGSICLYEKKTKSLFSGDTVFRDGIGRMDLPTGSEDDMKASLKRLLGFDIGTIYPGHGPLTTKDNIRKVLHYYFD
jgi:hydroxyacylglutathione hydrolase